MPIILYILYPSNASVAVRSCYENLRQIFLEQQSGKETFVEGQSQTAKISFSASKGNITYIALHVSVTINYYLRANFFT